MESQKEKQIDNTIGLPVLKEQDTVRNIHFLPQNDGISDTDSADVKNGGRVYQLQRAVSRGCNAYGSVIVKLILFLLLAGYTVYFAFALIHSVDGARALIVITCLCIALIGYSLVKKHFGKQIYSTVFLPVGNIFRKWWPVLKWFIVPAIFIAILLFMIFNVLQDIRQLQSVSGIVFFFMILYIFSKHPEHVKWQPVVSGFVLQFAMGVLVLRWRPGYDAFKWASDQITTFIGYSAEGASGVFGDPTFLLHPIAFVAMPMLIYVGAVLAILYYFGLTQILARKIGWAMQLIMGTTYIESIAIAANIFLNGMDIMLMLRPYLTKLTKSEFHCFQVGSHSTVAGFIFGLFVMFGAPPQHLLSAAVMSAPAAIAVSKLSYPETEVSCLNSEEDVTLERGIETNVIEAAANGAAVAGKTVAAVTVNLLAFLSVLAFINATLSWIGGRVGYPELSFEVICSYLFIPFAVIMGVDLNNARTVAKLVGIKVFTSEVIAYQQLGVDIAAGLLTERSAAIATYALCGFSGAATLTIALGVWNAVCPSMTQEKARQMLRVIINANISCFMTACIAGLLYNEDMRGSPNPPSPEGEIISGILGLIPSYQDLLNLIPR